MDAAQMLAARAGAVDEQLLSQPGLRAIHMRLLLHAVMLYCTATPCS